jgi:acetoacetyl-CoA synthetase
LRSGKQADNLHHKRILMPFKPDSLRPPKSVAEGTVSRTDAAIAQGLTRIWLKVLGKQTIGLEEDFFEAGGDPSSAIRLFEQIRVEFGRTIPPLTIYTARTIASLARLLTSETPAHFSNLLLLKPGPKLPAAFLFPGLGGNVMEFFALSRCIDWPHPTYGLQPRGSDGLEEPNDRIETMAGYHLKAIRSVQRSGPYVLCGYSLGGLVALEVARQIVDSGEKIALLCMIDSYLHESLLPTRRRFQLHFERLCRRASRALQLSKQRTNGGAKSEAPSETVCGPAIRNVQEKALLAWAAFSPRPYSGNVLFYRAAVASGFGDLAAWQGVIGAMEVQVVPGDHYGLLGIGAPDLAAAISRSAERALHQPITR